MTVGKSIKYRNIWMAVAIIWIVFFHMYFSVSNEVLNFIKSYGYGGVDIFFFASGVGCYFSYKKDRNLLDFYKRRWLRIMPTYLVFIIPWAAVMVLTGNMGAFTALGNVLGIQVLTGKGHEFNWYIGAIIVFYLLAPLFAEIIDKAKNKLLLILFGVFLLVVSVEFWNADAFTIIIARLEIFYMGMCFASLPEDRKITKTEVLISFVLNIIGWAAMVYLFSNYYDFLWSYMLWWYPFILITPFICLVISYISMLLDQSKPGKVLLKGLNVLSTYTFEIFLVNILIYQQLPDSGRLQLFFNGLGTTGQFLSLALIAVLSVVLKYLTKLVVLPFKTNK